MNTKKTPYRFTSTLIRSAWAIRREAAKRLSVKISLIVWGECLRMAMAGETLTPVTRLTRAADYLEKMMVSELQDEPDADPETVATVKGIIEKLRTTTRRDLDRAVWMSVFTCLGLKGPTASDVAMILYGAEGKDF